jgi:hypothetical protein
MQEDSGHVTKDQQLSKSMDYQVLRKEAIAITQQISGDKWTDYNIHDPGITILEQFCYTLTDIAYRTNLNIETLLFHAGDRQKVIESNGLFPAEEIFPTGPVSLDDYRILILDKFPNKISNCWVNRITDHQEGVQGLYEVILLLKSDVHLSECPKIKQDISAYFNSYRNLCEDLENIEILEPERICLSVDIDLYQDETAEEVLAEILFQIEHYFNREVKFSTLEELEAAGASLDEIFDIPSHNHGFITKDQLVPKQQEFYVSKIADYILNVKGVRNIRNLNVTQGTIPVYGDIIKVSPDQYLTLGFLGSTNQEKGFEGFNISMYKGGVENNYLEEAVIYSLEIMEAKNHRSYEIHTGSQQVKEERVNTKELVSYESIQKSFPGIYGIGDYTPVKEDGELRKAQSSQLKAYLMFFDQIMSNHLAQLSKIAEIFSTQDVDVDTIQTYFAQLLSPNTPDAQELIKKELPPRTQLLAQLAAFELSKTKLSGKQQKQVDDLRDDLSEKETVVKQLISKAFDLLVELPEAKLLRSRSFENRKIVQLIAEFQKLNAEKTKKKDLLAEEAQDSKNDKGNKLRVQRAEKLDQIEALMSEELNERTQFVDFDQRSLDSLMMPFDDGLNRKNRLMTHVLARFGERFTTDFHIKFSSLMEGETADNIDKKLISLKSIFLKEIVNLNRFRGQGLNYRSPADGVGKVIPLKRKISLLLNIAHDSGDRLASSSIKKKLKTKKLTSADIVREQSQQGDSKYIEPAKKSEKITFLVNSSSYYKYLFKYGLKEANYSIVEEQGAFVIHFNPPTDEDPTRLLKMDSKSAAQEKLASLIQFLKNLNVQNEGFHIVEHILLRPMESADSYFIIKGATGEALFRSKDAQPEELQKSIALDTLLLGCYPNNFKVLQNQQNEYIVFIKNKVGKEMAKSTEAFATEIAAQNFIDSCEKFFKEQKETDDFDSNYTLDNQKKYHFDLLDEQSEVFFRSINAYDIKAQEKATEDLGGWALNPNNYQLGGGQGKAFKVFLTNYSNEQIAQSSATFNTLEKANAFIGKCVAYFEELGDSNLYKSIIRYQRIDGRSAQEFNSQLSVVYSDWTARFHNEEFRQLFQQTFFNCAPAHLGVNVVGLDYDAMITFERKYFQYLEEIANPSFENQGIRSELSNDLLDILISKDASF